MFLGGGWKLLKGYIFTGVSVQGRGIKQRGNLCLWKTRGGGEQGILSLLECGHPVLNLFRFRFQDSSEHGKGTGYR